MGLDWLKVDVILEKLTLGLLFVLLFKSMTLSADIAEIWKIDKYLNDKLCNNSKSHDEISQLFINTRLYIEICAAL